MIDIRVTDYTDVFSITITDYQSGMDNGSDNEWYYELLEVGETYIEKRFKNWQGIVWGFVSTGDGDEGTLYIK